MAHKFDPKNIDRLDNPERRKMLPPHELLIALGLRTGDRMIDIGAGSGYFSIPASEIVGETGSVTAVDISEEMVRVLRTRIAAAGASGIEVINSMEYDLMTGTRVFDFAFMCTVLHEIEDRVRFLEAVRDALNPRGRVVIVEWLKKPMDQGPPLADRIGSSDAAALLGKAGFAEITNIQFNEFFYLIKGTRP